MNETLNNLKTRRSIRAYKPEQVEKDLLEQVLEAGIYAPTGGGRQTPFIVAVQDPETVKQLSRMNAAVNGAKTDPFYGAPTVLVVLADRARGTFLQDGSAVITTLLNAAHALGLGSCWINRAREMFDTAEGRKMLRGWGVEDKYVGVGSCILGYADCPHPEAKPRKEGYVIRT